MRIVQVNQQDARGGAAQVAWNLHRAYRARGLDAYMAVSQKFSNDQNVFEIQHEIYKSTYARFLRRRGQGLVTLSDRIRGMGRLAEILFLFAELSRRYEIYRGREDFYAPGTVHLLENLRQPVDVLHLHNLHRSGLSEKSDYFDLNALPLLSSQVPVVITMHDAWLLSGHCAHSFDCERWLSGCGQCPDLGITPALRRDGTAYNWQRKKDIYRQSRLNVSTPSHWLMNKVEKSILALGIVSWRVIPNGVDLSLFRPGHEDRKLLGLPLDTKILLFSADGIRRNIFKDFQTLTRAIAQVAEHLPKVLFVALGEGGPTEQIGRAEVRFVPYQNDPEFVARYYRAVDVYVHAARADTFPNSVIEALACGTPVVATQVGGIPEQVKDAETGFLTLAGDPQSMAEKIELLLSDVELRTRMSRAAAQDAAQRFDLKRQVDEYLGWYQELLEHRDAATA